MYTKLDKLVPNNPVLLNNLAWVYRNSNVKQGIKYAKKALSLDSDNAYIKDTLAMLLLGDNKAQEALKHAQQAAEQLPNFLEVQLNYAKVLIAVDEKKKAKQLLGQLAKRAQLFDQRQQIQTMLNSL